MNERIKKKIHFETVLMRRKRKGGGHNNTVLEVCGRCFTAIYVRVQVGVRACASPLFYVPPSFKHEPSPAAYLRLPKPASPSRRQKYTLTPRVHTQVYCVLYCRHIHTAVGARVGNGIIIIIIILSFAYCSE